MMKQTTNHGHGAHRGSTEDMKVCPDRGHKMVKGQMSGGLSDGRFAWACTNFPNCRRIDIERAAEEEQAFQTFLRLAQGRREKRK